MNAMTKPSAAKAVAASILVSGLSYQAGLTASTAAASASSVCSAYTALQGHRALYMLRV